MAILLNIDTATEYASVCLSNNGTVLGMRVNPTQKEHAAFVHIAIKELLDESSLLPAAIDAVAITKGPGSYTGLRVAMATAKGLCYALSKPLIAVSTLEVMAFAALQQLQEDEDFTPDALLCPMIDARRMEVFTALYSKKLEPVLLPCALVLEEQSFARWYNMPLFCFGSGSKKMENIMQENFFIHNCQHDATHLANIASSRYNQGTFADIVYLEPEYLKAFYVPGKMD